MTDVNTMVERLEMACTEVADFIHSLAAERDEATNEDLWRFWNTKARELAADNMALREIISKCASATGAFVSPECSIEFMSAVPNEISLALRARAAGRRE
ncbi:hypothetical protein ACTJJ7_19480 [Phyllobacterium sp. 22229]|uniref:hypothetical protein n=1 Tax=Phyllobacterium sp. 22229 TaxID=3453895 RepID=UPI003F839CDB